MFALAMILMVAGAARMLMQRLDRSCPYQANDAKRPGMATGCIMQKGHSGLVHCDKYGGIWTA